MPEPTSEPELLYLTLHEVAIMLRVSVKTIHRLVDGGGMPAWDAGQPGGDENLRESAVERPAAIDYLNRELVGIAPPRAWRGRDAGHYVRPK